MYKRQAYTQDAASLSVTNEALPARSAQVQELSFLGDPNRIAFFPLVSGRLPREGEIGVCALDADTAWVLFRSTDANGDRVRVNGDPLLVVGILDVERPLLMVPAAQDARFDRLAASSREELEALASALGEETDPFELSGLEIARVALLLCVFPIAVSYTHLDVYKRQVFRGDAGAVVLDDERDVAPLPLRGDFHVPARRRIADGVVHQYVDRPLQHLSLIHI